MLGLNLYNVFEFWEDSKAKQQQLSSKVRLRSEQVNSIVKTCTIAGSHCTSGSYIMFCIILGVITALCASFLNH